MMKPRLYEANTLTFTNNGFGSLIDAQECYAKQAFGAMELEMKYPVTGRLFHQLTYKRIILAEVEPLKDPQPFYIFRITKPMDGVVRVYGKHVCYQLDGFPVRPFTATTASEALRKLKSNAMTKHSFSFETNVESNGTFEVKKPTATWNLLGGTDGSVLDVFGGEYEFDQYTVRLLMQRGIDRGVSLRYGKNLQTLEQDANCAGCYTGVVPYWVDTKSEETVYAEPVIAEGNFGYSRILPVDFTNKFDSKPSISELEEIAAVYIKDNNIGVPAVSLKVKFVPLEQTEEQSHLALLERVQFGDTVHVFFPELDINVSSRIVETVYDCLRGRYKEVTIGQPNQTLADLIVNQKKEIEKIPQGTTLQIAMSQATQAIAGAKGGAVRLLDTDGDNQPDTIYVADNADPGRAVHVWRWNWAGWACSKNGYEGPFVMAATIDGGFVADFITTGNLNADLLTTGTLNANMVKVINLSADNIITGKLSVERLDVDNLVVKALRAIEERDDGFTGIIETDTGRIRLYSDDGSVKREVLDIGINVNADNFATNYAQLEMRYFSEGKEKYSTSISPSSIYYYYNGKCIAGLISGQLQQFGVKDGDPMSLLHNVSLSFSKGNAWASFGVSPFEGEGGYAQIDDLLVSGKGNCSWQYIESLGKTVLVQS